MKLPQLLLLLFVSSIMSVDAQDFRLPLYPENNIPFSKPSNMVEKWDTSDIVRISNVIVPDITVYLPAKKIRTGEAVVICPGGGYRILAWDWEGEDIAKFWNSKGVTAIVLKYRLPSSTSQDKPYLVPLTDAKRALRLVRYHAAEWGINPDKIGIMGFSAGGHLASTLSTKFDPGNPESDDPVERLSCRPDFSILIYPVITFTQDFQHAGSREALVGNDSKLMQEFSSELNVTDDTPPTFMLHAADDKGVPVQNTLSYFSELVKHKVPAELHIYPFAGHGFSLGIGKGHVSEWTGICYTWLKSLSEEK